MAYFIEPPPVLEFYDEPLPFIVPAFIDGEKPNRKPDISDLIPIESKPLKHALTPDRVRQAEALARQNPDVQKLLDGRHVAIGASLVEIRKSKPQLMFVFYNYDTNIAIEAIMNDAITKILKVKPATYQPAPINDEIEQAIKLVLEDADNNRQLEGLTGGAIQVEANHDDALRGHRVFDVRFFNPEQRLAQFKVLVDLSTTKIGRLTPVERN